MRQRIYTLDYLRGAAAFLILIYHYLTWENFQIDTDTFIRRTGFYGVTIFYILSGLTLFHVYNSKLIFNKVSLKKFFVKRMARILPLLCVVTIVSIILSKKIPHALDFFLNLTGLFGFFKWDTYYATGAWSIGNELVFYAFFPFIIFAARNNSLLFWLIGIATLAISLYFSYYILPFEIEDSRKLWRDYVNPLNQLVYFYSGIMIGKLFSDVKKTSNFFLSIVLVCSIVTFSYFPTERGNEFILVTGTNRFAFSILCWLVVVSVFLLNVKPSGFYHKPMLFLGEISYGLYLFHPIVYNVLKWFSNIFHISLTSTLFLLLSAVLSILVSYISYEFFEKRIVNAVNLHVNK